MEFKVREFNSNDIGQLVKIDHTFPPRSREPISSDEALKLYKKNNKACLVALEGKKVVAALFGELEGNTYVIKYMIIDPEYLGEGVADLLIKKALKATKAKNVSKF